MADPSDRDSAFDAACRLLAHRARSVAELEGRLGRKGFAPEVIEGTLDRLRDLELVDDAAFARARAEGLARRGSGPRLIRARLAAAGVDGAVAAAAIEAALGDGGEDAVARAALRRRYGDLEGAEADRRRKAAAYLVRRGFSPEVAGRVAGIFADAGA